MVRFNFVNTKELREKNEFINLYLAYGYTLQHTK